MLYSPPCSAGVPPSLTHGFGGGDSGTLSSYPFPPWAIAVYCGGRDLPRTLTRRKTLSPESRPPPFRGGSSSLSARGLICPARAGVWGLVPVVLACDERINPVAWQVGTYFLRNYYNLLQQTPDVVHQFYSDASTMVRVDDLTGTTAAANNMMVCRDLVYLFARPYCLS